MKVEYERVYISRAYFTDVIFYFIYFFFFSNWRYMYYFLGYSGGFVFYFFFRGKHILNKGKKQYLIIGNR